MQPRPAYLPPRPSDPSGLIWSHDMLSGFEVALLLCFLPVWIPILGIMALVMAYREWAR